MMTSGLIVQFESDPPGRDVAMAVLRGEPAFTVGAARGAELAVALEAGSAADSERWLEWLRGLPAVRAVEVVFVCWDDAEEEHVHAGV